MSSEQTKPIIIIIEDEETGSRVEYRVPPDVGFAINQMLGALGKEMKMEQPPWDSACRL